MSWDDSDSDGGWENSDNLVIPGANSAAPPPAVEEANDFDDECEEVEAAKHAVPTSQAKTKQHDPTKPKKLTKAAQKRKEEERLKEEARLAAQAPKTTEERLAEKMRLQKLVEEADHALTEALFAKKDAGVVDSESMLAAIADVPLNNEKHFELFAAAISKTVKIKGSTLRQREFLKAVCRDVADNLTGDDIVEVVKVLNVIKNEKVKAKLNKKTKKAKKKGKTFAKMSRDVFDDHGIGNDYDDYGDDDYDFM